MTINKYLKLSTFAVFACVLCACQDSSTTATLYPSIQAFTPQPNNTYVFAKGSQVDVPLTFTNTGNTDNQTPNLKINLSNLPQGWSVKNSNSPNFNCSTVKSSGTSCQLNLVYNAQTLLNTTALNLNYSYGSGSSPQSGSITILYKVINPTFMYVSNPIVNSLTKCIVNPIDGKFLNCEIAAEGLNSVSAISSDTSNNSNSLIAINYNSNSTQNTSLWQCPLDSEGNISTACSLNSNNLFPTGTYNSSSISLQTFLNNNYAYISNFPSSLVRCSVSIDGTFSGCANITVQGLNYPTDIAFLKLGSSNPTTYSYITQPAGAPSKGINLCTVSSDGSTFSNCSLTDPTDFPDSISVWGITFENFNNTNYAYVTTNDDQQYAIKQCRINDTGGLYGCVTTGEGFSGSAYKGSNQAVSFQKVNNKVYAYVPSAQQNNYISPGFVTKCTVDITRGNLNNCERLTDESTLFSPGTIAFIDTNS